MERNLDFKELFVESANNFCFHPFVIGSEDIAMDVVEVLSRVSNDDPSVVCTGNGFYSDTFDPAVIIILVTVIIY